MTEFLALITLVVTGIGVHLQYRSYVEQRRQDRLRDDPGGDVDDA